MAGRRLDLPVVDLTSADLRAAAKSICQACVEYGFFYVINHGIDAALLGRVFAESRKFFALPMEEKVALRKNSSHRGYTAPYSEKVDPLPESRGDSKECFYIGLMGDGLSQMDANQWPSIGKRILSLIALSLDLDAEFFHKNGAFDIPSAFLRLLHYSGQLSHSSNVNFGAAAHSDYGMLTLLATDGTPGLQICREKDS